MAGHPQLLSSLAHLNLEDDIIHQREKPERFGGMCDVFVAKSIKHNKKVAVKRIRAYLEGNEKFAKQLSKEILIWAGLQHENVLPLLGFILEGPSLVPSLISEWMEDGTLHDRMQTFPRACADTCIMLFGIATGLSYLHAKGIIHADLKSLNILISPSKSPLLADFKLSRMLFETQATTGTSVKGTVRWMAKELLEDGGVSKCDEMTDIWAFGMITYELLSWDVPYRDQRRDVQVTLAILKDQLPDKPTPDENGHPGIFEGLWELCNSCWSESSSRPSATECINFLASITGELAADPTQDTPLKAGNPEQELARLQSEWSTIRKEFTWSLHMFERAALTVTTTIEDLVRNILPYLLDKSDMKSKHREMKIYLLTLRENNFACTFVGDMKDVFRRFEDFKCHRSDNTKGTYLSLESDVKDFESSICDLKASTMKAVRLLKDFNIYRSVKQPPARSGPSHQPPSQKDLKYKIKTNSQEKQEASERASVKQMEFAKRFAELSEGTDDFMSIWNKFLDDVESIQSLIENGGSELQFKQRVIDLNVQYCDFRDFWRPYSRGSDGTSRSKKFFTSFMGF